MAVSNPSGATDQDIYLKALAASGSVDRIDYGHYVARVKYAPLARPDRKGRPVLVRPDWPIRVKTGEGTPDPAARGPGLPFRRLLASPFRDNLLANRSVDLGDSTDEQTGGGE